MRGQVHDPDETGAEDGVLSKVEQSQTCRRLQRCLFIFFQEVIVPIRFKLFVVEILKGITTKWMIRFVPTYLDGLVIDQRVDRSIAGVVIGLVHLMTKLCSTITLSER